MPAWSRAGRRAGLCLGLFLSWAAVAGAAEADPLAFLRQVQAAARTLDYAGVTVYQQGRMLQSTHLVHQVDGTGERERQEVLDGTPQECLRQNGTEQCLLPEHRLVVMRPAHSDHFPALLLGDGADIARHYDWKLLDRTYRVAGRECAVSELRARDALRYSYRICTDLKNHLLLKTQTLDAQDRLVDQVAFSRVHVGAEVPPRGAGLALEYARLAAADRIQPAGQSGRAGLAVHAARRFQAHRRADAPDGARPHGRSTGAVRWIGGNFDLH